MAAPKAKRTKTEQEETDEEDIHIQELELIQDQIEELNDKATEEILEVERKYNRLRKPIYQQRAKAIQNLPNFWFKVFTSNDMLAALLVGEDLTAFKYIKELNVEDHDDVKSGFNITLKFSPNPFFHNEVLKKEFHYDKEGNLNVVPTKIDWKEGKDLTKKTPSTKDTKAKRSREDDSESFFTWFNPDDQDLELAEIIKEELWPNPAKYYLGEVEDEAEEEGDEEGDEGEDDGEEGEDGDDGEAEEEDQ